MSSEHTVRFSLGGLLFEYDEEKNRKNLEKHGISFKTAARVFFDYDRIEMFDDEHIQYHRRYLRGRGHSNWNPQRRITAL